MKKLAAAFDAKSAEMMKPADAERLSGYKTGGMSPFGQTRKIPVVIEKHALAKDLVYVNGGQRGLQVRCRCGIWSRHSMPSWHRSWRNIEFCRAPPPSPLNLKAAGRECIFSERASGAIEDRPELLKALEYARQGDIKRSLIRERVCAGLQAARQRGRKGGRPPVGQEKLTHASALVKAGYSTAKAAQAAGIGRVTYVGIS